MLCVYIESQTGYGCELNFTILVEDGGVTEAAELALFKKSEPNADQNLLYYVFIVYKPQNATNYATVVEDRYIFPSCNSWQVFNLSSIKSYFPPGVHKINLLIAVFKDSLNPTQQLPEHMSCEETKSLFVMDSNVNINEFLDQPAPQDQSESKTESPQVEQNLSQDDGNKNDAANNQTPEEIVNLEEGEGSGGEELHETNPAAKYRPELSVFVSGTSTPFLTAKRSVGELTRDDQIYAEVGDGKDEIDQASGSDCKRLDKKIFLSEFYPGVLQPQIVNVGQCFNSSDSIQCLPSKYMNLEILRKIGEHQLTIQTLQNFIITECTPYANAHDQPIPPV